MVEKSIPSKWTRKKKKGSVAIHLSDKVDIKIKAIKGDAKGTS